MDTSINNLLDNIGKSDMLATAYDTAWVARLTELDRNFGLFALEWLCENQLPDGSWGSGQAYYYHDRVICTLSAMIALAKCGKRQSDKRAVEKGLLALEDITANATRGLSTALKGLTVGFEMIVPTLVVEAESLGIIKQQKERILGRISQQRVQKLSRLKGKMINRHVTIAFSAEMAGKDGVQMLDIENLQELNGSVGCSPSATAYYLLNIQKDNTKAIQYLHKTQKENGGIPNVAPFDVFEIAWTLWNLSLIPGSLEIKNKITPHLEFLSRVWDLGGGAGFSSEYSVNDSDGTSVVFDVLSRFGIFKDIKNILYFEEQEYFRCFALENDPSISSNIHVLSALRSAGFQNSSSTIQKIINFLAKKKNENGFFDDKWHISPYYTTAHAIIACAGYENRLVENSIQWILDTQKNDGSWGIFTSTSEETAYAIQALWIWGQSGGNLSIDAILKAKKWLDDNPIRYEPLWIGKCLYSPKLVIDSAVFCANKICEGIK